MAEEPNERLQKARIGANYSTAADAARAFGWNPTTYQAHESGMRGIRPSVARRYAAAFRISVAWLLTGGDSSRPVTVKVPIVGYVGAGAEVVAFDSHLQGGGFDEIEAPPGCDPGAVAVIVRGDSCFPIYEDGEVLIYSERRSDIDTFLNRPKPIMVGLMDGRRFLKQIARGANPGLYTLTSPNASPIPDQMVEWVARFDWTKPKR